MTISSIVAYAVRVGCYAHRTGVGNVLYLHLISEAPICNVANRLFSERTLLCVEPIESEINESVWNLSLEYYYQKIKNRFTMKEDLENKEFDSDGINNKDVAEFIPDTS